VKSAPQTSFSLTYHFPAVEPNDDEMARSIGRTLRDLRKQRSLSLNDLARSSGVSTSMLSQMENGRSTPSVAVLWKIAKALDVPVNRFLQDFEAPAQPILLRSQETPVRVSAQGKCVWRTLQPPVPQRKVEFYEITLRGGGIEEVPAAPDGTWANLAVAAGEAIISLGLFRQALRPGDTLQFPADTAHALIHSGRDEAVLYLVISPPRREPGA
jgi:transcriptional regulator with XRE-family HTH domain